ncbi:B-cell receptor CD22-like [Ictalurus furcatus]|uniref:B-cell receptor CD22-like n=1 Tax=Ictalurus furcatus TaxID=66913 RepID=UPI002350BC6B|nr:B-cell receptor CD22-like [Ictalurus furcatus]
MLYRMWRDITVAAILMLLTGVQAQHSVTLSSQSLCVVTGSTVKIPCKFIPGHSSVTQTEWYRVQSSEGEPRDLRKDPQYSGRVSVSTWWSSCELTVRNVRVSDSGIYNFRFKTQRSDWISASSGVHLTVTDLQVKVDPNTVGQRKVKVTCSSTCSISTDYFNWYRNGLYIAYTYDSSTVLDLTSPYDEVSYSCKVHESEHRSPPVCVFDEKSCWSVTYSTQTICSLIGSSVDIHSYFTFPNRYKVTKVIWFIKGQVGVEPVDVREDEEYQGRVQYTQISQNNCSLRITNLRERDAQTYRFRFYTDDPAGKYTGHPGVSLSVTDLKVTVSDWDNGYKKLSCTTCTLSNNPTYIWYKNGQRVTNPYRNYLYVSSEDAGSYSCAVRGHEELRSPAVCVLDEKSCWSVTYSTHTICSVIGSSVDIHSYYTFPNRYKVTKSVWFIKEQAGIEVVDVREDEEYQGRVQYTQISQNNCSLRITNLRERDAQTYRFRFYTDGGKYTGDPGVSLSVTDLKVTVSDWSEQYMKLSCITTCTLSNNPTYIWYKNGQRVSECKSASCSVAAVGGAVSYSCAVEGHDSLLSPPVYSPKNTSAVVLSSGDTVEGDSVTLSCSSDANPPVLTYSWFKQRAAADTLLTTGQNYSISNISSQHSGLYYCTAHNQLGQHNSTPTLLDVKDNSTQTLLDVIGDEESSAKVWKLHAVWGAAALVPALLLSLLTAVLCIKRKGGAERDTDIQGVPKPGDDTYTALNPMNTSPDYDTLQYVKSDTYTTLNSATMSSDNEMLTGVATRLSEEKYSRTGE